MELHYFKTLPSTSTVAAAEAKKGAPHLYTVIAEEQTAGRGRLQRSFFSPRGGLYFSTVLRTALTPAEYGVITPFAALAVRRAIQSVCGVLVDVKWVNDLLYGGRKVCGILAESGTDLQGKSYVILGIGINLQRVEFPGELADIAISIPCSDSKMLLQEILLQLSHLENEVRSGAWLEEYRAACTFLGKEVSVIKGGEGQPAFALDILASGALLVRYPNGSEEALCGGEISLRLTQAPKK